MKVKKYRSLERKLDNLQISVLEEQIKILNHKVEVLTKIHSGFKQGDRVINIDFKQGYHVRLSDDDKDRELKVTRVTVECAWVKWYSDKKVFLKRRYNVEKVEEKI